MPRSSSSSPGRSLRDFTSPWPVPAKRTRAASIRAWTTRSRRARSRTAARNGHLHLSVRKGIHERLKAVAIGGHASIIASPAASQFCPEKPQRCPSRQSERRKVTQDPRPRSIADLFPRSAVQKGSFSGRVCGAEVRILFNKMEILRTDWYSEAKCPIWRVLVYLTPCVPEKC